MKSFSEIRRLAVVAPETLEKRAMEILRENHELKDALEEAYHKIDFLRGSLGSDQSVAFEVADTWMAEYDAKWGPGPVKTCPQCKKEFAGKRVYCTDACFLAHECEDLG